MAWTPTDVTVSMSGDVISIQIGPEGYTFSKQELVEIVNGAQKDILFLVKTIAVALKQANVNMNNLGAVKTFIEGRQWPW